MQWKLSWGNNNMAFEITDDEILYTETVASLNVLAGQLKAVADDQINLLGPGLKFAIAKLLREQADRYNIVVSDIKKDEKWSV